jgi:diguanylate cyclase (GGDEF)-like protein
MTPNFAIVLERSIPESYSEHDKSILQTITSTAGFALERVLQFEKGKDLAMRDGLTGLINHRTMHEKLYAENLRAERQKVNIGLLMMDIDKFKSINDTYGHPAGDEILKGIAKTIMSEVRSEIDLVARYGGEEFVVALIDTSESGLKETAERIRKTIEATSYNIKQKLPLNVTVSIGAYLKHPNGKYSMAECLKFADTALYKAKEGGRNQVKEYLESEPDVLVQDSE